MAFRSFQLAIASLFIFTMSLRGDHPVQFAVKWLSVDANEGCDIADVDGDGKPDVIAGRNWYHNDAWLARPVRVIEDLNGYARTNGDFAYDVNQDGHLDVIAGEFFHSPLYWYENPGRDVLLGNLWQRRLLCDTGQSSNEASYLHDIDGDGRPEWITNQWNPNSPLIIWRLSLDAQNGNEMPTLVPHPIGQHNGHGIGFGDINNDGREDILVGTGWYERPGGDPFDMPWQFHSDWNRPLSCPVIVRDVDQDGRNDLIWGNPHDFGLFLWRARQSTQAGKLKFDEEVIDDTFSQAHCVHLADLDGDGQEELITGKRVRAHNGNDPGGSELPIVCYYIWNSSSGQFKKYRIAARTVGIGLQIRTADLDGDSDIDLVLAGKDGTQILFNQRLP